MAVLQPNDPNKKYIYTLKPDADVNDIYYTINLNATKQQNFEFDVNGTSRAEFDLNEYQVIDTTINSGSTTSAVVDCGYWTDDQTQLVGIYFPATFTSSSVTFTSSNESTGVYHTVKDIGGASTYTLTVSAGVYVPVDLRVFAGQPFIKVVGNSSETGNRTLKLSIRQV
jgi:hypothetical protein